MSSLDGLCQAKVKEKYTYSFQEVITTRTTTRLGRKSLSCLARLENNIVEDVKDDGSARFNGWIVE